MNKELLKKSYEIVFLMFVCITVFLYARSNNNTLDEKSVVSLQLSALVTSIAAFHYFYMIQSKTTPVTYRYFDWFFTTPILLIDLCILLDIYETNLMFQIISLNTIMLLIGYLGEMNILSMMSSTILGFIPFIIMFYLIYSRMQKNKVVERRINTSKKNTITETQKNNLFNIFIVLWASYGVNHLIPNVDLKNLSYNILDLITKGFFGLYVFQNTVNLY